MTASLAEALQQFHDGTASETAVVACLDTLLTDTDCDPDTLLRVIDEDHTRRPLPETLVRRLRERVREAARVLATGSREHVDATRLATGFAGTADSDRRRRATGDPTPPGATRLYPSGANRAFGEPAAQVGDTLNGRFYLEELIGEGGMSLVFRALDRLREKAQSRNPYVALKVLDVVGPSEREAFIALQREAQKSQTLNHPNIVRVHDFHQDGDIVYMTMEYLPGVPLSIRLKQLGRRGLPAERALGYINQMGEALIHAHGHRILHADFKPSNVLVTDDDVVKVIDFGIARAFRLPDDPDDSRTRFQVQKLGALTPMYASAEMIEHAEPDPRDDVYSLACVAYELFTGRHPFGRAQATTARDANLAVRRPNGLTNRQWRALRRALAFRREDRTPTVRAFLDELHPRRSRWTPFVWAGTAAAVVLLGAGWWLRVGPVLLDADGGPASAPAGEDRPVTRSAPPPALPQPGNVLRDCPACPRLVVVPAGTTVIGAEPANAEHVFESPPLTISIDRPFALGITEVTRAEFAAYVEDTGSQLTGCRTADSRWQTDAERSWQAPGYRQAAEHPVSCVSWLDAQAYLAWLNRRTGRVYRLPSEAEWEYAARAAGTGLDLSAAPATACRHANVADAATLARYPGLDAFACRDGFAETAPAGFGEANGFGLYGMRGNLFEWTQDCWNPSHAGAPADGSARELGDCNKRVLRGGSWFTAPEQLRITFRNRFDASYRSNTFGFRVAREIEP